MNSKSIVNKEIYKTSCDKKECVTENEVGQSKSDTTLVVPVKNIVDVKPTSNNFNISEKKVLDIHTVADTRGEELYLFKVSYQVKLLEGSETICTFSPKKLEVKATISEFNINIDKIIQDEFIDGAIYDRSKYSFKVEKIVSSSKLIGNI